MIFPHPRLLIDNFTECFLFYQNSAGLRVAWGYENDNYASFTNQGGKEIVLALFDRLEMAEIVGGDHLPADTQAQDRVALIFHVEDVDAKADRMQMQGIQLISRSKDFPGWGIRSTYLRGPSGNLLELYNDLDRAEWTEGLQEAARTQDLPN